MTVVRRGPGRVPGAGDCPTAARTGAAGRGRGTGRRRCREVTPGRAARRAESTSSCCSGREEIELVRRWTGRRAGVRRARGVRRAQRARAGDGRGHRAPAGATGTTSRSCTSPQFNAADVGLRRRPDHGDRARHPGPGLPLHRRAAAGRRGGQRAGPALAGGRHRRAACGSPAGRPLEVFGMGPAASPSTCRRWPDHLHDDVPQADARRARPAAAVYLHPYPLDQPRALADRGDGPGHAGARRSPAPRRPRRCPPAAGAGQRRPGRAGPRGPALARRPGRGARGRPGRRAPACAGTGSGCADS